MKSGFVAAALISSAAVAGYTPFSRLSEVKRIEWSNQAPTVTTLLGSTTSFGSFVSAPNQNSATTAGGATYSGRTDASGGSGPPAGSGRHGTYTTSSFELVFDVSGSANFSLTGSLQRYFNSTSVLKLTPLTAGASPALTASATGTLGTNFDPTPVNWAGTLVTGRYKLSILERGEELQAGEPFMGTVSSFTFSIPGPSGMGAFAIVGVASGRRRRAVRGG